MTVIAVLALSGCESAAPYPPAVVHFISEPPGAKIEVNGNFIGVAPCDASVTRPVDVYGVRQPMNIVAYPAQAGTYEQWKFINPGDQTPQTVYFNMGMVGGSSKRVDLYYHKDKSGAQ